MTFYRAINLNGSALVIDGNQWEAESGAADFTTNGSALSNQWIPLSPATDPSRASMILSWRQHWAFDIAMSGVPGGTYQVYVTVVQDWNDPDPSTVTFSLEGQAVGTHTPGAEGEWSKLGPFTATISDGTINLTTDDVINISGLEVWRAN